MDKVVNINNTKDNVLEFELVIEGATASEADCNFVIIAKGMELRFPALLEDKSENKWSVKIPEMPFLERTAYNCYTEVVAEGQYFKPLEGNVNVVGPAQIYTSTPKNKTLESDIKKGNAIKEAAKVAEKSKSDSWRGKEKPIAQIAKELMEKEKYGKDKIEEKVQKSKAKPVDADKNAKIKAILEETGLKPKKKKKKVSFVHTHLLN